MITLLERRAQPVSEAGQSHGWSRLAQSPSIQRDDAAYDANLDRFLADNGLAEATEKGSITGHERSPAAGSVGWRIPSCPHVRTRSTTWLFIRKDQSDMQAAAFGSPARPEFLCNRPEIRRPTQLIPL